jgi:UrcA family protein
LRAQKSVRDEGDESVCKPWPGTKPRHQTFCNLKFSWRLVMSAHRFSNVARRLPLLVVAACGLALSTGTAGAQDYDRYDNAPYASTSDEQIEVIVPRHHTRSAIGAEVRDVAFSREVRVDDLDLRTLRGERVLRARIRNTAGELCHRLDVRYPVTTQDSPPCFRRAVENAMYRADGLIENARASAETE